MPGRLRGRVAGSALCPYGSLRVVIRPKARTSTGCSAVANWTVRCQIPIVGPGVGHHRHVPDSGAADRGAERGADVPQELGSPGGSAAGNGPAPVMAPPARSTAKGVDGLLPVAALRHCLEDTVGGQAECVQELFEHRSLGGGGPFDEGVHGVRRRAGTAGLRRATGSRRWRAAGRAGPLGPQGHTAAYV